MMQSTINQWRDKTRKALNHFSHWMGEATGTTLQSIDTQARANESLSIETPSLTSLLPYESYDSEGLFINQNSMGFGLALSPMAGADETLMKSLAELFKNKLTDGTDCTVMLYKHPKLASNLHQSYAPILKKGGIYAELARMSLDYHIKAIQKGYKNTRNVPATLTDYRSYLFISRPKSQKVAHELKLLREDFESELKVSGFGYARLDKNDFTGLLKTLLSPNFNEINWPKIEASSEMIADNLVEPTTVYEVFDEAIHVTLNDEEGARCDTRLINCELSAYPKEPFALWQTPDFFANLLKPEQGIQCPFLLSFTIRGVSQERMKNIAKKRAKSLIANNNAIQNFINPTLKDEACEWRFVHEHAAKDELHLYPTFYNLILYSHKDKVREHVAKAISSYRQMGFRLTQSRCKQWLRFLGSLPFMLTEGLFSSIELLGMTKQLSHFNVANLLPVVADFKGSHQGLLLPTYRHQLFFYDPFDDKTLPITNYNRLTIASPGAGKSYLQQALLLDGLSRGHQIFVIDVGDSYKHLCQMVGGTYIDATTLTLNPFTLFDFEGEVEIEDERVNNYIQMRDLLAIMASPDKSLDGVQKDWLLDALLMSWKKNGKNTRIDDILSALRTILQQPEGQGDRRLKDLLVSLNKYGSNGIYGAMFNGQTPLLNSSNFTVIELGGFKGDQALLTIVTYVMIVIIQGQFYHSDRRIKKQCNFDEMWRAFESNSNPIAANFLNQGYRTARKYNAGFSAITQNISDTQATLQGQAISACSDTKFIMRQGGFKEYIAKHPDTFSPLQQKLIESFGEAKMQGFSDLMIQFGTMYTVHRYFSDPFSRVLFSTSGDEFGDIEALMAEGVCVSDAVARVAYKYYKDELCA
jgi:conjugal transfer ATP-binding protein TraC